MFSEYNGVFNKILSSEQGSGPIIIFLNFQWHNKDFH